MSLRLQVLNAFKKCHRARLAVFQGDALALEKCRESINETFRKNLHETDETKIKEQLQVALDAENMLRTSVIQAVKQENGNFRMRITEDTLRLDNVPFRDDAILETPSTRRNPCGGAQTQSSKKLKEEKP